MIASVIEGGDGKFHIVPLSAGMAGFSWKVRSDAERAAHALNCAYERGKEDVRREFRSLLNVAEGDECQ